MCLILVAWRSHPQYPLVVAANRDEFFARRTASADFWADQPQRLAGRDLEGGGTWMGVTRTRPLRRADQLPRSCAPASRCALAWRPGRGLPGRRQRHRRLPRPHPAPGRRPTTASTCCSANAIAWSWFSNVAGEPADLAPGVYGVSNHLLDSPWPKVGAGKTALAAALDALPDAEPLFELLRDDSVHPDEALPRTGVSLEWERLLSSAFVRAPGYGTRSSTVLTVGSRRQR